LRHYNQIQLIRFLHYSPDMLESERERERENELIFISDTNKVSFLNFILGNNYFLGNESAAQKSMNSSI